MKNSRTIKNIVMFILIFALLGVVYFTMNYAKDNITVTSNNEMSQEMSGETPPEMPSENTSSSDSTTEQSEMPSDGQNEMMETSNGEQELTIVYYVIFGVESLVIALLVVYLILSGLNKKTFKETFSLSDKIIIAILSVIILTGGLGYLMIIVTNNCFLNRGSMDNTNTNNSSTNSVSYSSSKEITADETLTSGTYSSTKAAENAILVNGDINVTLKNIIVTKTGDSNGGDSSNFYGNNSAILAKSGANLTLTDITVTTNASGANGVFSYGGSATTNNSSNDGTSITISDSKITTTGNNAGGIMTTGGGITKATNLTVETSGTSSAAIRSDRGGGVVTVDKGTYTTTGQGSPAIYSTAKITVSNATLNSSSSEGVVIEGANTVILNNCKLTDNNTKLNGQSTTYKNIFLYQSMSGDASNGNATFTATDSTITTNKGDSFYITNTKATINLTNNTIVNNDSSGNFLRAKEDSWGTSGSNGGNVTLVMTNQKVKGNIVISSISNVGITMKTNSSFEGTINGDNTAKSITLTIDKTSKVVLTGNSYLTSLTDADSSYSNIDFNGYKLYVNGKTIN